jgi:3-methyladenine DNA glycosylase/8-oxoguanine DNA glycosylase
VFLPADAGLRAAARSFGITGLPAYAQRWRPWRSYATMHLLTNA